EDLDAGAAGQLLKLGEMRGVAGCRTNKEREVAMHAVMATLYFVGQSFGAYRRWIGIWHLEHGSDSAHHRRKRAAFEIFLVGQTGLAKMHLGIDYARQEVQPSAINDLAGGSSPQVANRRKAPAANADVTQALAVLVDHGAALEDQIVAIRHPRLMLRKPRSGCLETSFETTPPGHSSRTRQGLEDSAYVPP